MLRSVLMAIGALCLLLAALAAVTGLAAAAILPLLAPGLLLFVGLAVERWRYKPLRRQRVDPRWQDTGERFVDPETGKTTAVYFDPATAERHYIVVDHRRTRA